MYTRILTPLDGSEVSEHVLPYARALASSLSLPMTLLLAIEPDYPTIGQALNPTLHWHETETHRSGHAEGYLASVATGLRNAGLTVDTIAPRGEPATAIVEEAAKDDSILIAMTSHGRSGFARWWMGSVADKVLHMARNPLLIVRSQDDAPTTRESPPERLIVPVDGSELAEEILSHVAYLSTAMGLPVYLVCVTMSEDEYQQTMSMGRRVLPPTLPPFEAFSEALDGAARRYLAEVREQLTSRGVASIEERVLQGPPADAIVDIATSGENSLVAMTTHGRSGVGRIVLGSVAERVVRQSGGPVLLVRAQDGEEIPLTGAPAFA